MIVLARCGCWGVAPLAGAWIEIAKDLISLFAVMVAPLAGAWIEIAFINNRDTVAWTSLPSRERGLKYAGHAVVGSRGASLPSRERGLKW